MNSDSDPITYHGHFRFLVVSMNSESAFRAYHGHLKAMYSLFISNCYIVFVRQSNRLKSNVYWENTVYCGILIATLG